MNLAESVVLGGILIGIVFVWPKENEKMVPIDVSADIIVIIAFALAAV